MVDVLFNHAGVVLTWSTAHDEDLGSVLGLDKSEIVDVARLTNITFQVDSGKAVCVGKSELALVHGAKIVDNVGLRGVSFAVTEVQSCLNATSKAIHRLAATVFAFSFSHVRLENGVKAHFLI